MAELEDERIENGSQAVVKPHKKEKKHKHKKEKKHKRHKEKRKSPEALEESEKLNEATAAVELPNNAVQKVKGGESSESGEIQALEKSNEDCTGPSQAHVSGEKHELERSEEKDSKRARLAPSTDVDNQSTLGVETRAPEIRGTEEGDRAGKAADQTTRESHREAPGHVAEDREPLKDGSLDKDSPSKAGDRKLQNDPVDTARGERRRSDSRAGKREERHSVEDAARKSSARHRSKTPDRTRAPSRDRSRAPARERSRDRSKASHRSNRRERSVERPRSRYDRPHSRERRRSPDRGYRREVSRDRRRDPRDRRPDYRSRSRRPSDPRDRHRSPSRRRHGRDNGREREQREARQKSQEKEDKEYAEKVIAQIEEMDVDEDELIEQRRRKRQELQKKLQQEKQFSEAVAAPTASESAKGSFGQTAPSALTPGSPGLTATTSVQDMQAAADSAAQSEPMPTPIRAQSDVQGLDSDTEEEEMAETMEADLFQADKGDGTFTPEAEHSHAPTPSQASSDERHKLENQNMKDEAGGFDMFAENALHDIVVNNIPAEGQAAAKHGLVDQFDDSEGYYTFQVGEVVNERYEVFATHGKGVFSTVLRARDLHPVTPKGDPIPVVGNNFPEVAIKVIRSNKIMTKAGKAEEIILQKLAGADPTNKYHVVRLLGSFLYRGHLCLVFEPLEANLRQLTKKYGQGIGLKLEAVRSMAAQMLMALHLMKQCGVLHADIKPDNILINKGHNIVKICDFGSAMFTGTNQITPYLVSRFYRAPEIILGLNYDHPLDVWSIGCVVYELFTGRILFPGRTNNEMLKLIMDLKGAFPKKMLKKAEFRSQHFEDDPNMSFCQMEIDPLTQRPVRRLIANPTVKRDFRARLSRQGGGPELANLIDFLEKMLMLDPEKRITAKEALRHPFIKMGRPQHQ